MATINEVAKRAGVSAMTVSRVMNGSTSVTECTRKRVLAAADELGYRPNLLARGLVTNRTNTIGVLVTNIVNPIYSVYISTIIEEANRGGYDVIIAAANERAGALQSVSSLLDKRVDGLILLSIEFRHMEQGGENLLLSLRDMEEFDREFEGFTDQGKKLNIPFVTLGRHDFTGTSGMVNLDYHTGARMAVDYLVEMGHRDIGFLMHTVTDRGIWMERYTGFGEAVARNGLTVRSHWEIGTEDTIAAGFNAMLQLLDGPGPLPTALCCANDQMAVGATNAAASRGLRVPEDISIIGSDGNYLAANIYPPLTTISIQPEKAAAACFHLLEKLINGEGEEARPLEALIPPKLIERSSVKRIAD